LAEYEARRLEFRRRRDFIVPALRGAGLPVPVTPDGAFYVYADCSAHSADSSEFAIELLERIHVSVVPGKDFGRHEPARHLRLSYATAMDKLEDAVTRLARYLPNREREGACPSRPAQRPDGPRLNCPSGSTARGAPIAASRVPSAGSVAGTVSRGVSSGAASRDPPVDVPGW